MRSRLVVLAAVAIATVAVILTAARGGSYSSLRPRAASDSLPHRFASYLGVYEKGPPGTYQPVTEFAKASGRHPNLVGYYSGWGVPFARSFAETVHSHGAVTILQMDPTYASIPAIAAGGYDHYLRTFADSVRDFGHPVVIGFGHEMNADWYSWGYKHVPAPTFVAAWRTSCPCSAIRAPTMSPGCGRSIKIYPPQVPLPRGGLGLDMSPGSASTATTSVHLVLSPLCSARLSPRYGPSPASRCCSPRQVRGRTPASQRRSRNLFAGMRQYQTLGLVWFDIAQHQGIYHQDWRIEDNRAATTAFRRSAASLKLVRP